MNDLSTMAILFGLAVKGGWTPDQHKHHAREQCVECYKQIPPGKPGRKCKECRNKQGVKA